MNETKEFKSILLLTNLAETFMSTSQDSHSATKPYNVKILRPCRGGGVMVDGHFGRELSMHKLCSVLRGVAKCSERLGVARLSHQGCDITIYRKGRVVVHGVASEEDAVGLISDLKVIVESAFVETDVDGLIAALRDENPKVRQNAAATLGEVADERAVAPLACVDG